MSDLSLGMITAALTVLGMIIDILDCLRILISEGLLTIFFNFSENPALTIGD